ncbi:MAG: xanthine dehydrogenase family protein subunit M [Planctomycetes bacterium]|nr:xanthine dehydrogenase family protein subunit M [Planctomycetota bacterium]MCB9905532.1 xanthine dehydrogenase family protein subunit M [Planctomycetota bacterium]
MTVALRPTSLSEALDALGANGAVAVAGCTDLMVVDHAPARAHATVVDLSRLPELRGVREDSGGLWIGAATTFAELRESKLVRERFPIVAEMAGTIGALQIQNRATVGGNIANASPAGDSLPVWMALDAEVEIAGRSGSRRVPYDEMHRAYRETALAPGELIVGLRLPAADEALEQRFRKVGTRAAQAISKVVVALAARVHGDELHGLRIAAGSVAPTPVRLRAAEALVEGQPLTPDLAAAAGLAAAREVTPIDDVRSTADYRRFVLARTVRRMLLACQGGEA